MCRVTTPPQAEHPGKPAAIPVPGWAWALVAYGLAVLFVILQDNGQVFVLSAGDLHDFFHDARHALGVPCH